MSIKAGASSPMDTLLASIEDLKKLAIIHADTVDKSLSTPENRAHIDKESPQISSEISKPTTEICQLKQENLALQTLIEQIRDLQSANKSLHGENLDLKNALDTSKKSISNYYSLMLKLNDRNTSLQIELAASKSDKLFKRAALGFVVLCSLYPLGSKFCTTETARMIANGAVQLCSALKRGLTGARADQLV